ncbi:hypothetical protein [Mucilaginibacter polytrichastri]|uniref:Uncharacterized protein n=1 Tax=Mucilaginibacter polytrichastri TaxID=1302689 RepID=A0A1Q6A6E4_9SPHI|nr:hypothetical protein [Mucilaginibacter polytrichastri]OKS89583.1 hypothetical protein RG47T_5067 [Mucilaginibacter polytrichastri]SFS69760.1 hypothetical protein SAMN04487890_10331 [Mucilaginibacter polytrichastri]
MFEKLFLLVKSNAGTAVINNPVIPAGKSEAVINEASSSIIEVLKSQLESGKIKDLIKMFQFPDIKNNEMVTSIINRFANKLNKFYNIDSKAAFATATSLIMPVMQQMVQQSNDDKNGEFAVQNFLSKLSGGADLSLLVNNYMAA